MDFTPAEKMQALVGEAGVKQVRDAVIGRLRLQSNVRDAVIGRLRLESNV